MIGNSSCSSVASRSMNKIVNFVQDFLNARIRPVDLVDDDDRRKFGFERLHQDVTGLGQAGLRWRRPASRTPSTIFNARSTSPPKSLWPGVSTILILTPW